MPPSLPVFEEESCSAPPLPPPPQQGCCSGESTHHQTLWSGFNSRTRSHMWTEFVVGSRPGSKGFSSQFYGFPPSTKTNIPKFQFNLKTVDERAILYACTCVTNITVNMYISNSIYSNWKRGLFSIEIVVLVGGKRKRMFGFNNRFGYQRAIRVLR